MDNRFERTERLVVVHQVSITDGFNAGFGFALGTFMVTVVVGIVIFLLMLLYAGAAGISLFGK